MYYRIKMQALLSICLLRALIPMAQKKMLQVGDQMPDIVLNGLANYPDGKARIGDFKGKLLIIDFWDRGCTSCIESFPRIEALQEQFKGRIQILIATKNSVGQIDTLFTAPWILQRKIRRSALPSLFGDTVISGLFEPFFYVPHHIWIDGTGKILYITGGYNATAGHIQAVLEGRHPLMLLKKDVDRDVTEHQSLSSFVHGGMQDQVRYSSFFSTYLEDMAGMFRGTTHIDSGRQEFRVDYLNYSIFTLFRDAFTGDALADINNNFFNDNRIIWKIDSAGYRTPRNYDSMDEWTLRNCYTYEQIIPLKDKPARYRMMQEDLNRYFNRLLEIGARIVTIRKKCLVLVNGDRNALQSKSTGPEQSLYSKNGETPQWRQYVNIPFRYVVSFLTYEYASLLKDQPLPFIDETHFTGNADLRFELGAKSIADLNRQLAHSGLKIIIADRMVKMLQIEKVKKL